MYTTFRITKKDLNKSFLEALNALFKEGELEISVSPVDETAYLLKSEANKKRLLKSVKNIKSRKNLVEMNLKNLK